MSKILSKAEYDEKLHKEQADKHHKEKQYIISVGHSLMNIGLEKNNALSNALNSIASTKADLVSVLSAVKVRFTKECLSAASERGQDDAFYSVVANLIDKAKVDIKHNPYIIQVGNQDFVSMGFCNAAADQSDRDIYAVMRSNNYPTENFTRFYQMINIALSEATTFHIPPTVNEKLGLDLRNDYLNKMSADRKFNTNLDHELGYIRKTEIDTKRNRLPDNEFTF